jgi:hypothetical protein
MCENTVLYNSVLIFDYRGMLFASCVFLNACIANQGKENAQDFE